MVPPTNNASFDDKQKALQRLRDARWLNDPATQAVFAALHEAGHVARGVGGAVRNSLLGLPVADIDIATTATPDQTIAAAQNAGLKVFTTGLQHGTVTVMSAHVPHEVTTLRKDVETDGRHAKVAFTTDWHVDAARRDFTMNALYCGADGSLFDPLCGYGDLIARRVRFINDPLARIKEDYLRILRFFRFNAQYGRAGGVALNGEGLKALDPQGLSACIGARGGLAQLSAERIGAEMLKLLGAPLGVQICEAMSQTGFLPAILGIAPRLGNLRRLAALERDLGLEADPVLRLAALSVAVSDDVAKLARRLRLSRAERRVLALARGIDAPGIAGTSLVLAPRLMEHNANGAKRALYFLGREKFTRLALLSWANRGALEQDHKDYARWRSLYDLPAHWTAPVLPISGGDLVAMGLEAGPKIGACLNAFEQWWIEAGFPAAPKDYEPQLQRIFSQFRTAE